LKNLLAVKFSLKSSSREAWKILVFQLLKEAVTKFAFLGPNSHFFQNFFSWKVGGRVIVIAAMQKFDGKSV